MADYLIVCVRKQVAPDGQHTHIVGVGLGAQPGARMPEKTVAEVLRAIDQRDRFFTRSPSTGNMAMVEPFHCSRCSRTYIRSSADSVHDNNLDLMKPCA